MARRFVVLALAACTRAAAPPPVPPTTPPTAPPTLIPLRACGSIELFDIGYAEGADRGSPTAARQTVCFDAFPGPPVAVELLAGTLSQLHPQGAWDRVHCITEESAAALEKAGAPKLKASQLVDCAEPPPR